MSVCLFVVFFVVFMGHMLPEINLIWFDLRCLAWKQTRIILTIMGQGLEYTLVRQQLHLSNVRSGQTVCGGAFYGNN